MAKLSATVGLDTRETEDRHMAETTIPDGYSRVIWRLSYRPGRSFYQDFPSRDAACAWAETLWTDTDVDTADVFTPALFEGRPPGALRVELVQQARRSDGVESPFSFGPRMRRGEAPAMAPASPPQARVGHDAERLREEIASVATGLGVAPPRLSPDTAEAVEAIREVRQGERAPPPRPPSATFAQDTKAPPRSELSSAHLTKAVPDVSKGADRLANLAAVLAAAVVDQAERRAFWRGASFVGIGWTILAGLGYTLHLWRWSF